MVKIIGNVKPEDDYTHPLGPEPNFNESVYFNFFDRAQNRGGFLRIGNRANEKQAEMTVIVYNADGSALFNYKRPAIESNDGWNAGGLEVTVLVPGEKLRTRYEGSAVYLADPRAMKDPGRAFKQNPHRKIVIDLVHDGVGPIYGHVGKPDDGNDFARAHYEQHMKVSGSIEIEGEPAIEIRGHGLRDHSWGPRYWQSTPSYRWITGNFGDDLGMVISIVGDHVGGVFHKGQELLRITGIDLETDYESGTNYHSVLRANVTLSDGAKHRVEGRVRGFIPLRNRRAGQNTHIGEGMTEYTLDGERIGYGLSEYLDQGA
ncbi:MAG: hypothetical protein FJ108_00155 [Deltaproteobacteria bacterium]|nr:hypothetical protein [Deltaproteobacteria bacterium]